MHRVRGAARRGARLVIALIDFLSPARSPAAAAATGEARIGGDLERTS